MEPIQEDDGLLDWAIALADAQEPLTPEQWEAAKGSQSEADLEVVRRMLPIQMQAFRLGLERESGTE